MAFTVSFASGIPPSLSKSDFKFRSQHRVRVRSELPGSSEVVSLDRAETVFIDRKGAVVKDSDAGRVVSEGGAPEGLELLYDDGCGTSVIDYIDVSREMIKPDGGPPRWFCPVECGLPIKGSPLLLFLPGIDGVGLGLILHQKSLGKIFEVRCMHIPVYDRTPFEGVDFLTS